MIEKERYLEEGMEMGRERYRKEGKDIGMNMFLEYAKQHPELSLDEVREALRKQSQE